MAVYTINAHVTAQDIAVDLGDVKLVSGSQNIYQVQFDYSDEWTGFTKKVVFETGYPKRSVIELLISGTNIVTIPERTLSYDSMLKIGIYGVAEDTRFPTVWSKQIPIYSGTKTGNPPPPAPETDVYNEILAAMAGKQDILTWDETPTDGSNNPVKSNGIYDALETKANTNGIYPSLIAGSAEQMLSENYTVDKAPYLFRSLPFKSNRVRESIVGGSFGWNQLLTGSRETSSTSTLEFTNISTFSTKIVGTGSTAVVRVSTSGDIPFIIGHKYLLKWGTSMPSGVAFCLGNSTTNGSVLAGGKTEGIVNCANIGNVGTRYIGLAANGVTLDHTITLALTDLTAMFPTAIVDYVWTLEQATAGSGIAWLKSYGFFTEPYYSYDAGSIQSVSTDAHIFSDGVNTTTYALDPTELRGIPKLDANNNLYYDGDVYEADETRTRKYAKDNIGDLAWDKVANASLDIGYVFRTTSLNGLRAFSRNFLAEGYLTADVNGLSNIVATYGSGADKIVFQGSNAQYLYIIDGSYSTSDAFETAKENTPLIYELATPVTETATPFPSIESLYANGTEQFTDYAVSQGTRDVGVPVGHDSEYLENSQAKLDGLPWNFASLIAPTEVTFTATRNYTTGDLLIINNVLYKATSNIANGGTITVGSNVTATTLAEVISAL